MNTQRSSSGGKSLIHRIVGGIVRPMRDGAIIGVMLIPPLTLITAIAGAFLWKNVVPDVFGAAVMLNFIPGEFNLPQAGISGLIIAMLLHTLGGDCLPDPSLEQGMSTYFHFGWITLKYYLISCIQSLIFATIFTFVTALLVQLLWHVLVPIFSPSGVQIGLWLKTLNYQQAFGLTFPVMWFTLWVIFAKGEIKRAKLKK